MSKDEPDPMNLPENIKWGEHSDGSPSLLDFIGENTSPAHVLAIARFLWPRFLEIKGCVLLPWVYEQDAFEQWWQEFGGDKLAIESTLNHIHLWDVFYESENTEGVLLNELGRLLAITWSHALKTSYPERSFTVRFSDDPDDYGPTVTIQSAG